jgi:methionine synthase II (cobalamin-independent)
MAAIRTTHTGSLHRPAELESQVVARETAHGEGPTDTLIREAVAEIVQLQVNL